MRSGRGYLLGTVALVALVASAAAATAGGLANRQQSTSSLGAAYAGASAGGDLSSSFWNPAALGVARGGSLESESHYALIAPSVEVRSDSITVLPPLGTGVPAFTGDSIEMDRPAIASASYYAYRWNKDLVLGASINTPFGLGNETSNDTWSGQYHFRSAKLTATAATAMASYQVSPGLMVGAGLQAQFASLRFKANPSSALAPVQDNSILKGDDIGFGYTLGVLWQPSRATSIGLGYRSRVHHTIEGDASMANGLLVTGFAGTRAFTPIGFNAKITTPDIANLSIRQDVAPGLRLLGSVEWTNWSVVDKVDFIASTGGGLLELGAAGTTRPGALLNRFDFHWKDGWMYSLGGEYDWSRQLTLRSGVAYEVSPIRDATMRKVNITDADRVWLSLGANYKWSASTSFDFAYSHVFFGDAPIDQLTTSPASATTPVRRFLGSAEQSADIVALSMKTRW